MATEAINLTGLRNGREEQDTIALTKRREGKEGALVTALPLEGELLLLVHQLRGLDFERHLIFGMRLETKRSLHILDWDEYEERQGSSANSLLGHFKKEVEAVEDNKKIIDRRDFAYLIATGMNCGVIIGAIAGGSLKSFGIGIGSLFGSLALIMVASIVTYEYYMQKSRDSGQSPYELFMHAVKSLGGTYRKGRISAGIDATLNHSQPKQRDTSPESLRLRDGIYLQLGKIAALSQSQCGFWINAIKAKTPPTQQLTTDQLKQIYKSAHDSKTKLQNHKYAARFIPTAAALILSGLVGFDIYAQTSNSIAAEAVGTVNFSTVIGLGVVSFICGMYLLSLNEETEDEIQGKLETAIQPPVSRIY